MIFDKVSIHDVARLAVLRRSGAPNPADVQQIHAAVAEALVIYEVASLQLEARRQAESNAD